MSEQELRQVAHRVSQLYGKLRKLVSASGDLGLCHFALYRRPITQIEKQAEHLGSIAEGLYMSLNDDFSQMLRDAAEELSHERRCSSRRAVVEQMQG